MLVILLIQVGLHVQKLYAKLFTYLFAHLIGTQLTNMNLAIANRSRVSCAHYTLRAWRSK